MKPTRSQSFESDLARRARSLINKSEGSLPIPVSFVHDSVLVEVPQMGEMSSDTAEQIGNRLAEAMVEQCADLGGSPEDYCGYLDEVLTSIRLRVEEEQHAAKGL
jgi:hypothetical protein